MTTIRKTTMWILILGMFGAAAPIAADEPPEEVRAKLEEEVNFNFVDTPLDRALQAIQMETGLSIVLDPQANAADRRVTLKTEGMTAAEALDWIEQLTGLRGEFRGRVWFLTTPSRMLEGRLVTRLYDTSDLTFVPTDFVSPEMALAVEEGASVGAFEEPREIEWTPEDFEIYIEQWIEPETWRMEGPGIEVTPAGLLVVRHTEEVHERIGEFLDTIRDATRKVVAVEGRFLSVDNALLREIGVDLASGLPFTLEGDALAAIDRALEQGGRADTLDSGNLLCFNKQRAYVSTVRQRAYVRDFTTITNQGAVAADPELGYIQEGMILDVRPVLNTGDRFAILSTRATLSRLDAMRTRRAVAIDMAATPGGGEHGNPPTERGVALDGGEIDLPEVPLYTIRSQFRVPVGKIVALAATSDLAGDKHQRQVLLLLRVRVVEIE